MKHTPQHHHLPRPPHLHQRPVQPINRRHPRLIKPHILLANLPPNQPGNPLPQPPMRLPNRQVRRLRHLCLDQIRPPISLPLQHLCFPPPHSRQQPRRQPRTNPNPIILPHPHRAGRALARIGNGVQPDRLAVAGRRAGGFRGQGQGEGDVDGAEEEVGARDEVFGFAVRGGGVALRGGQGGRGGEEEEVVGRREGEEGVEGLGELLMRGGRVSDGDVWRGLEGGEVPRGLRTRDRSGGRWRRGG